MPIYEYRCEDGHTFEVMQRMTDDPVSVCEVCQKPVQRVFHPVAVHYKGSGFYSTDYGKKKRSGATDSGSSEAGAGTSDASGDSASSGDSQPDAKTDSPKADSKPSDSTGSKPKTD